MELFSYFWNLLPSKSFIMCSNTSADENALHLVRVLTSKDLTGLQIAGKQYAALFYSLSVSLVQDLAEKALVTKLESYSNDDTYDSPLTLREAQAKLLSIYI